MPRPFSVETIFPERFPSKQSPWFVFAFSFLLVRGCTRQPDSVVPEMSLKFGLPERCSALLRLAGAPPTRGHPRPGGSQIGLF